MEKLSSKFTTIHQKKPYLSKPRPTLSPQRSYLKNPLSQSQKPQKTNKESIYFHDRLSLAKKNVNSYKVPKRKNFESIETSRSLIVSSRQTPYTDRLNFYNMYENQFTKTNLTFADTNFNKVMNQDTKKNSSTFTKPSHFSQFLELAKKQKERHIPAFSLMFTPKLPEFNHKTEPFIIEELRQTEDTIHENQNIFIKKGPKASDFHQVKLLGKGKNGEVYLAIHKATGFACAMKVIKKADINKGTASQRQILHNQLLREIKLQLHMSHPNLIELYCVFSDRQNIYLIQQLGIDGQLYDLMKKKFKFSEQSTALISREILKGLKFMHEKHIIHRDIKPQNIVLSYGIAKLCDFGWSVHCPLQLRSTLCGTPLYLSPQVLIGDEYNEKIDIWAFGTLVYELFTGENPFKIKNKSDLKKIVTEELNFSSNFPRRLRAFLESILKKKSSQRPRAVMLQNHQFLKKYSELETSEELSTL